jgi:hypothetical protein
MEMKIMTDEQKLFNLITKPHEEYNFNIVEEYKWSVDSFYIWIPYLFVDNFVDEIINIFGEDVFDDGGCDANMQRGYLCIDLEDLLGGYVDIKEVFAEDKLK